MLRDSVTQFGTGCGGASVAIALAAQPDIMPMDLTERLSRERVPISCVLAERTVLLCTGETFVDDDAIAISARVGTDGCRLHLSPAFVEWLQQPLHLDGALVNEAPTQRALLLELASLDLLRVLEAHLGKDIRFGESFDGDLRFCVDLAVVADQRRFALRLELTSALAEIWADGLDRLQPPDPIDLSGLGAEIVIQAGSQDLSVDELEGLRPGDIVVLASPSPAAVVDGKLIAAVRHQSDGIELAGAFFPVTSRARAGSLPDLRDGDGIPIEQVLNVTFEFGRITMTLGEIDRLKPGRRLPLAHLDDTGVDIVVEDRRVGRGELVTIGAGVGVRIIHLLPTASARNSRTS